MTAPPHGAGGQVPGSPPSPPVPSDVPPQSAYLRQPGADDPAHGAHGMPYQHGAQHHGDLGDHAGPAGHHSGAAYGGDTAGAHTAGAHTAGPAGRHTPPDVEGTSVGELFGRVAQDLSTLLRQELELAKAELRQEAVKTGKAAGALGAAGFAGYMVALFLSLALWGGLSNVMDWGWAGLIVAVLWGVVGAALYVFGRGRLRQVRPVPQRTVDTIKDVPDAVRGR